MNVMDVQNSSNVLKKKEEEEEEEEVVVVVVAFNLTLVPDSAVIVPRHDSTVMTLNGGPLFVISFSVCYVSHNRTPYR